MRLPPSDAGSRSTRAESTVVAAISDLD